METPSETAPLVLDEEIIAEGTAKLAFAVAMGRTTREQIAVQQLRDIEVVKARDYWGDCSDEQRLVTRGIKLRIEARRRLLSNEDGQILG